MALGDYSRTTFVNGTAPAISATNLNNNEAKTKELDTWASTANPVGSVIMYAGSTAPTGWLLCNGQDVSRTTYSALFSAIGTTWGVGNGSTTFNLPDMRGAAPAGVGTSTGYTQNETLVLGTKYNDQMQGHHHTVNAFSGATDLGKVISQSSGSVGITAATILNANTAAYSQNEYKAAAIENDGTNGTPRTGNVTRGKRVGLNFIIKY